MKQAIKIIDEMIANLGIRDYDDQSENTLIELKTKLSSLPSDTQWIDTLQRYTNTTDDGMEVSTNGYWVSYKDVYDLPRS